jgi:hypothetical protein
MGRPINKRFIGNTSQSGQQLQATAFFPGAPGPVSAYIRRQIASNTYDMVAETGLFQGRVQLAAGGVALNPGQANLVVTPFGAGGSGATSTARMGAVGAAVVVSGTGAVTADYDVGNVLTVIGGTNTAPATFTITDITVGNIAIANAGSNYNIGNRITIGGVGWVSNAEVTISGTNATGAVTGFTFDSGGRRNTNRIDIISGTTLQGSNANVTVGGVGATFNARWGLSAVSPAGRGVFSALPANPVSTTTDGSGTGGTVNVSWSVTNVVVSAGGTGYNAARVVFTPAGADATATVNAAGNVSAVTVNSGGPAVTVIPTVDISPINSVQHAQEIRNRTVTTFSNQSFEWVMSNEPLPASDLARLQSS